MFASSKGGSPVARTSGQCHRFHSRIPPGDDRVRQVCRTCGFVDYDNPKILVGVTIADPSGVLLCRRAIEPRLGFWTIPSGHLEPHEAAPDGAIRETLEECGAEIELGALLGAFSWTERNVVELVYRGTMRSPRFHPTKESSEVGWFAWHEIPWTMIAFPSTPWAIAQVAESLGLDRLASHAMRVSEELRRTLGPQRSSPEGREAVPVGSPRQAPATSRKAS